MLQFNIKPTKGFLSVWEFSFKTGIQYSIIVHRCKSGKLKALQENKNSKWLIHSSELERHHVGINENTF